MPRVHMSLAIEIQNSFFGSPARYPTCPVHGQHVTCPTCRAAGMFELDCIMTWRQAGQLFSEVDAGSSPSHLCFAWWRHAVRTGPLCPVPRFNVTSHPTPIILKRRRIVAEIFSEIT
ncbi:hypothetical protein ACFX1Z_028862 [Malus domestica]